MTNPGSLVSRTFEKVAKECYARKMWSRKKRETTTLLGIGIPAGDRLDVCFPAMVAGLAAKGSGASSGKSIVIAGVAALCAAGVNAYLAYRDEGRKTLKLEELSDALENVDVDTAEVIELQVQPEKVVIENLSLVGPCVYPYVHHDLIPEHGICRRCDVELTVEVAEVEPPKDWVKNKVRVNRRKDYAAHVAQRVKNAYPNLCECDVDRQLARKKAVAIMADDGVRPAHVVQLLPKIESMTFMKVDVEIESEELQTAWWWWWSRKGLRPRRSA